MRSQRTASIEIWPEEASARNGVVVAGGYGLRIHVERGRLQVDDGIGANRRRRQFHRATSGLKRLVVLGHTGYVSLEALRWLADIKAAYLQVDADGRVLATFGPLGTDRPPLRRAQALVTTTEQALTLSRWLVDSKLAWQAATLTRFAELTSISDALAAIETYRQAAVKADSVDDLRFCEAGAAASYWQALGPLKVRFARRDTDRIPSHWHTFGGRSSPIANGPRMAANPANAVLNYLYALLEAEATLAARIVGLDPGLGVMHADQVRRDSLAADLMEPVRPRVDAYVFELLTSRAFAARDFHETRSGVCRLVAPLNHELAETLPRWRELVGRVAEDLAAALERGKVPTATPISGRRRANSRPAGARPARRGLPATGNTCAWCGGTRRPGLRTCSDECRQHIEERVRTEFVTTSSERMRELAKKTDHPAYSAEANERRRATRKAQREGELAWDREHPEPADYEWFRREVLPKLSDLSTREIARATGMSISYCADIKRGGRRPHPRHWGALIEVAAGSGEPPVATSGCAATSSGASAGRLDGRSRA